MSHESSLDFMDFTTFFERKFWISVGNAFNKLRRENKAFNN